MDVHFSRSNANPHPIRRTIEFGSVHYFLTRPHRVTQGALFIKHCQIDLKKAIREYDTCVESGALLVHSRLTPFDLQKWCIIDVVGLTIIHSSNCLVWVSSRFCLIFLGWLLSREQIVMFSVSSNFIHPAPAEIRFVSLCFYPHRGKYARQLPGMLYRILRATRPRTSNFTSNKVNSIITIIRSAHLHSPTTEQSFPKCTVSYNGRRNCKRNRRF